MALPTNADVIVVHGYWLDELTGLGVKQANGLPATIMFDPVPLLGANAAKTPNLRDLTSNAHLKTRTRVATVDPVTGYYAAQLVASNDPDLDAYSGRKVTFLGEDPFTIEVPYNAPTVTVSAEMAAKTGLTQGSSVKAIWLPNASVTTIPTPTPPNNYLSSAQTLANIAAGIETHDEDPTAHADIRALIPAAYTDEQARDALAAALVAGSNVTITPNDGADTITISASVPSSYSDEQAQDAFAALIAAGTHSGISFTYNDAGNALSATVSAQSWSQITGKPSFAAVATSGAYGDLTGKPTFAAVATSGTYSDLTGKPTIPAATNDAVTYLAAPSGDSTGATDTTAIRAAISAVATAGGGVVRAQPGKTYQVAPDSTTQTVAHPSGSTASRNPCIVIPAGVVLDMNGSTLQLRGSTQAWLVANGNTSGTGTRDHDLGLRNAVLDFNSVSFTDRAGLHLSHVDRLLLENVKIVNGSYFGAWVYNINDGQFDRLAADTIQGQPWQFGDPQAGGDGKNQVYRCRFGSVRSTNITLLNTGSQPGNVFALCGTDCTIDSIIGYNCTAGVKIYAPGTRNAFGTVVLDTVGESSALNSGFKFQGDGTWGNLKDCSVAEVVATNQASMGLAMLYTENCSVGSFIGRGNCTLATNADVFLGGGQNDFIAYVNSTNSGGGGVRVSQSPTLTQVPTGFRLPNVKVTNPGIGSSTIKAAVRIDYAGASGTFGDVVAVDNQTTHTMNRAVDVTVTGVTGSIATLTASGYTVNAFNSSSTGFTIAAAGGVSSVTAADATITVAGTTTAPTVAVGTVPTTSITGLATIATSGSADNLADGTTNKAFLATERTKLTGIATAATANSSDATLLARANHTGTQAATTITGLAAVATSGAKADVGLGSVENRPSDYTVPTGIIRTTIPRNTRMDTTVAALVSGRLTLTGIYLVAGDVVTSLTFFAGGTAAATPTNQWFSLYSSARAQLGITADNTTTAWAANGAKTLSLTTPYTVTTSGLYYVGVTVVATTVPTLTGASHGGTSIVARPPILAGGSTTGLTDPASAPTTAGTLSAIFGVPYVEIS